MSPVSTAVEPLPPTVDDVLQRYWGFDTLRPLQGSAIRAVLERRDSVVVLPTGGGKSLCFQVPALIGDDPGIALVVSPLIALMKDQVDGLVASGVPAARLDSTMSSDARQATFNGLRDGRFKLLYVSPERLMGDGGASFQATVARRGVRYVAIDEAHCISHWGHDFRPEYRQLGALRAAWPQVSMHAFTATATTRVREDIVRQLGLRDALLLVGSFDRPNLIYRVRPRLSREQQLDAVMAAHRNEAGIIYCISRKDVDQTAAALADAGHKAVAYHAGLSDDERSRNQDAFIDERADVVVATVAFGMGVDRSDVRFVDPRRGAQVARALPAGSRPRRPRRPGRRVRAALFVSRLPQVEADHGDVGRAERSRCRPPAADGALRQRLPVPAQDAGRALRPDLRGRPTAAPATSASAKSSGSRIR